MIRENTRESMNTLAQLIHDDLYMYNQLPSTFKSSATLLSLLLLLLFLYPANSIIASLSVTCDLNGQELNARD